MAFTLPLHACLVQADGKLLFVGAFSDEMVARARVYGQAAKYKADNPNAKDIHSLLVEFEINDPICIDLSGDGIDPPQQEPPQQQEGEEPHE